MQTFWVLKGRAANVFSQQRETSGVKLCLSRLKCSAAAAAFPLLAACSDATLVKLGPGEFAPETPLQTTAAIESLTYRDVTLHPRATYSITAKVLSKRHYRFGELSEAANWDFALGWGPMSDEARIENLRVTQGDRLMFLHLQDSGINLGTAQVYSANVHLITENPGLEAQLEATPEGAIVKLSGHLVDVELSSGKTIPTSLTRRDIGRGACEILYVSDVSYTTDAAAVETL